MSAKSRNLVLLTLIGVLIATALVTLVPYSAEHPNDLGYFSLCPFAPWSTLSLLLVAGLIGAVRSYLAPKDGRE